MAATAHEMPAWECSDLLRDHRIGRLCLVDGGYPIAVPMNDRLLDGDTQPRRLVVRRPPDPEPILAGNRDRWLLGEVAAISGRRFVVADAADGCSVEWQLG